MTCVRLLLAALLLAKSAISDDTTTPFLKVFGPWAGPDTADVSTSTTNQPPTTTSESIESTTEFDWQEFIDSMFTKPYNRITFPPDTTASTSTTNQPPTTTECIYFADPSECDPSTTTNAPPTTTTECIYFADPSECDPSTTTNAPPTTTTEEYEEYECDYFNDPSECDPSTTTNAPPTTTTECIYFADPSECDPSTTTNAPSTVETTTLDWLDIFGLTLAPDTPITNKAAQARKKDPSVMPNGKKMSSLTDEWTPLPGNDDFSRMVANKNEIYVLHPVQTGRKNLIYDPYTIGEVLGYIYELQEFGVNGPPGGFTMSLMGRPLPDLRGKRGVGEKSRRAALVFKKKSVIGEEEEDQKEDEDLEKEYWRRVLRSV